MPKLSWVPAEACLGKGITKSTSKGKQQGDAQADVAYLMELADHHENHEPYLLQQWIGLQLVNKGEENEVHFTASFVALILRTIGGGYYNQKIGFGSVPGSDYLRC